MIIKKKKEKKIKKTEQLFINDFEEKKNVSRRKKDSKANIHKIIWFFKEILLGIQRS